MRSGYRVCYFLTFATSFVNLTKACMVEFALFPGAQLHGVFLPNVGLVTLTRVYCRLLGTNLCRNVVVSSTLFPLLLTPPTLVTVELRAECDLLGTGRRYTGL